MDAAEIGVDTAGDAYLPQSGNGGYSTISISLSLRYRIARNRLDGTAELLLRAHQRLARFSLDLVGLSASGVRVDGRRADFRQAHGKLRITPHAAHRDRRRGPRRRRVRRRPEAPAHAVVGRRSAGRSSTTACWWRRSRRGRRRGSRATTTRSTRRATASASRRMPRTPSWPTASSRTTGSSAGRACGSTTSASPRRATWSWCRSGRYAKRSLAFDGAEVRRVLPACARARGARRLRPAAARCSRCSRSASGPTRSGGTRSS